MIESMFQFVEVESFSTNSAARDVIPGGGTIGGTAVDATGTRMNIEIPALRGAALHYPRRAASGFMATIGIMNDL